MQKQSVERVFYSVLFCFSPDPSSGSRNGDKDRVASRVMKATPESDVHAGPLELQANMVTLCCVGN